MTTGIASLPFRSSPTSRFAVHRAAQLAHAQSTGCSTPSPFDTMFANANKAFEANPPPPRRTPLAKQALQSSSPVAPNGDIRRPFKQPAFVASASARSGQNAVSQSGPLESRSVNNMSQVPGRQNGHPKGSIVSLYTHSDSFKHEASSIIDLTGPGMNTKAAETVYFAEDDFSDDDNLDLDFEAPSALPNMPPGSSFNSHSQCKENMPPPPTSTASEKHIPWSSSPASHFVPPDQAQQAVATSRSPTSSALCDKRASSGEADEFEEQRPRGVKRRFLPNGYKTEPIEVKDDDGPPHVAQTPHQKSKGMWDQTPNAIKEQKKMLKTQRSSRSVDSNETMQKKDGDASEALFVPRSEAISLSKEQRHVLDLVVNKHASVFFTGPAGTGKSVLMRAIIKELKAKYSNDPERVAVTASTGLAACNIGGVTLHSFSGIGLGKEDAPTLVKKIRRNNKAKTRWLKTKCLIVDEISMVDGDLFDKLSQIGRVIRQNGRPWGGIQLIVTGDFFQLPPVPDSDKKREVKFAFDAAQWNTSIDHTIGLTQVFRQRDPEFANMLNEMRLGRISDETEAAFKALSRPLTFDDGVDSAELYPTRLQVEGSNERRLRELPGRVNRYDAMDAGDPAIRDRLLANMMAPKSIELKLDAQVMLIKNLDETLVNGSLGKVIAFADEHTFEVSPLSSYSKAEDDAFATAARKLKGFSREPESRSKSDKRKYPVVQFITANNVPRVILCQPEEWKVELPNGEVQAKRTQLPLILAWALSIHKAQGQTLERVTVNLGKVFEKGQAYVALSRATSPLGLQVLGFEKSKVMAHPHVVGFYDKLCSAEEAAGPMAPSSILDFLSSKRG